MKLLKWIALGVAIAAARRAYTKAPPRGLAAPSRTPLSAYQIGRRRRENRY